MEDSFGDIMDNDTSERHIVLHIDEKPEVITTPPYNKKAKINQHEHINNFLFANNNSNNAQHYPTKNNRQSALQPLTNFGNTGNSKYSVAFPIP